VLRSGLIPTNADAKPGWLEIWAANTSLQATLAREAPKGPNPVALMDENLITGIDLYGHHCAICHGTAKGEATDGVEDDPEGYSFWMIKHGIRWTEIRFLDPGVEAYAFTFG